MNLSWQDALQGVTPITGGAPLPPATYRLRIVGGEGKLNSNQNVMLALQFEVESGPLKGRKAFHNENLPRGTSDAEKQRMGFFLGLMSAFGLTGEQLGQMFAGRPIDEQSVDYLAKALVQSGRVIKGTCSPQKNDETRINWRNWTPDDGIEPEPPKQIQAAAGSAGSFGPPSTPNGFAAPPGPPQNFGQQAPAPNGLPQGGFPGQAQTPAAAPQPGSLPLGGFAGSAQPNGMPNAAPDWATQQPVQGQAPQTFQTPAVNQQPQYPAQQQGFGQQPAPQEQQGQFPGQQFPGQVNPAEFPPQGQQQGFNPAQLVQAAPGQQMPGMPPAQPQQQAPAGLPQGGFPPVGGQPPQANI